MNITNIIAKLTLCVDYYKNGKMTPVDTWFLRIPIDKAGDVKDVIQRTYNTDEIAMNVDFMMDAPENNTVETDLKKVLQEVDAFIEGFYDDCDEDEEQPDAMQGAADTLGIGAETLFHVDAVATMLHMTRDEFLKKATNNMLDKLNEKPADKKAESNGEDAVQNAIKVLFDEEAQGAINELAKLTGQKPEKVIHDAVVAGSLNMVFEKAMKDIFR